MNDIVQFTAYKNCEVSIDGFLYLDEADDEKPLRFLDERGFENGFNFPRNPFHENENEYYEYEQLITSICQDAFLIQVLVDYSENEKTTVNRPGYKLKINY